MPHVKKRQNTETKAYKFWARPIEPLPQEFWDTAKKIQRVWNNLIEMREKVWEEVKDLPKEERIPKYKEFEENWKNYLKSEEVKNLLGNDEREFLLEKFDRAEKEAKKAKASLRKQYFLDKVFFRHRYSGGGKPLDEFKRQNSSGFLFSYPRPDAYVSNRMENRKQRIGVGKFGIVKDRKEVCSWRFSSILHRELPEDAVIKSVSWTGRMTRGIGFKKNLPDSERDWKWSIVVTVEVPRQSEETFGRGRVVALDVGWRKLSNNFLRIGALHDSDGNKIELRCPISYTSCNVRYGKLLSSLYDLFELDELIGKLIENTKQELVKLNFKNLTKTRQGGLFKLQTSLIKERDNTFKDDKDREFAVKRIAYHAADRTAEEKQKAIEMLESFRGKYEPMLARRNKSFNRLNNYRDWLYQNIASWLAEQYDAIIWEGKLNLKKMAEDRKDITKLETKEQADAEKIRRLAAKNRQFASLYKFRDYIKKAFAKKGKRVIDGETAYTSRTCSECGERVEKFHNIEFVCPNGHNFDRDFNATQNLLNQLKNDFIIVKGEPLKIPSEANRNLSRVLVKMTK